MKLNNLSRLTALLMAMMMLCMCSAGAESGIDWSNLTGSLLADTDEAAALIEEGYCETCVGDLASQGITEWPLSGYNCIHTYFATISASEAYDLLLMLATGTYAQQDLYYAYINAHNTHYYNDTENGYVNYPAVMCCSEVCTKFTQYAPVVPGEANHDETCPWHAEEYTPSVTSTPDVSTPDALANVTEVVLNFTATSTEGTVLTYTWQKGSVGTDGSIVWEEANSLGTGSTYTLAVTPVALTSAYRCVVTDADGNVVSTSSAFYLGGKAFFVWATSTESDGASVAAWLSTTGVTMEYALAAYAGSLKGILLTDAIHITTINEVLTLIELYGLTALAEIDAEGNVIDVRYHIAVATYKDGVITALSTDDTTATN